MSTFEQAYIEAYRRYSPCAIISTRLKGFQVVDLDSEAFFGDLYFVSTGNMSQNGELIPLGQNGDRVMAAVIFAALGGPDWDVRELPDEISDEAAAAWERHYANQRAEERERQAKWKARQVELGRIAAPAPKKRKLKKLKRP